MQYLGRSKGQRHQARGRTGSDGPFHVVRITLLFLCITGMFCCIGSVSSGAGKQISEQPKAMETRVYQDLLSVAFPNEKDGWAIGRWGTVLHSTDGGMSWERQVTGTDYTLTSVSFVDSKSGWVVGDGGTILHTRDGGKTWEKQKSPVQSYLMGVHFATSQKGWAVSERTTILHTSDGGKTWQVQFKDDDYILKSVSFCDERNGWTVGEYGLIYHTEDGGLIWKKQAGGFKISEETGEPEAGNILFGVTAVNPKTTWVVGIDGYVAKTTDGGKTWQQLTKGIPNTHLFCIKANKTGTLLIGGKGIFISSTNNGQSWKPVTFEPSIRYGWIYNVSSRGDGGFIAVGGNGAIYLSGGKDPQSVWHKAVYK